MFKLLIYSVTQKCKTKQASLQKDLDFSFLLNPLAAISRFPHMFHSLNAIITNALMSGCHQRLLLCTIKPWDVTAAAATRGAGRRCLGMYVLKRKMQAGFRRDETAVLAIPPWLNFC